MTRLLVKLVRSVPTLMLSAGRDWVVSLKAQREFFNALSSSEKRMHVFPAAFHALFHEKERAQVVDRVREFISERFAASAVAPSLLEADKRFLQTAPDRRPVFVILTTDPGATKDFEHFCQTTGCQLVEASEQPGGILRFLLKKPD